MQLAENANTACCIRVSSQLHGQTDRLKYFCANSYVTAKFLFKLQKIRATGKLHGFECFTITVSYFTSSNLIIYEYQRLTNI